VAVALVIAHACAPEPVSPAVAPGDPLASAAVWEAVKSEALRGWPAEALTDVSRTSGVDFVHEVDRDLRPMMGSLRVAMGMAGGGVSAGDVDGDGRLDLYFAGLGGGRLYRNLGGLRFEDVTLDAGLAFDGEARTPALVDFDNDGDPDLHLSFVNRPDRLMRNDGGHFVDISAEVGLSSASEMHHQGVWADLDEDGLLDLYSAGFGRWDKGVTVRLGTSNESGGPNLLYRHELVDGQHRLVEIGEEAGVWGSRWTQCVAAWDADEDGDLDLLTQNDFAPPRLFLQEAPWTFREGSGELRLADTQAAMNFSTLDVDGDGHFEVYVSQVNPTWVQIDKSRRDAQGRVILGEQSRAAMVENRLFWRDSSGLYRDRHPRLVEPAPLGWSWGVAAVDLDLDGDEDLVVLNGTLPGPDPEDPEVSAELVRERAWLTVKSGQRNLCFAQHRGLFHDVSDGCAAAFEADSRAVVAADLDGDGDLDLAINSYLAPARILRNNSESLGRHWVQVRLRGRSSNRDGLGARVRVASGATAQHRLILGGSGFQSVGPFVAHFGLGSWAGKVDVEVRWPSGRVQRSKGLEPDRLHRIVEPAGLP
jgi:hypothetical protein